MEQRAFSLNVIGTNDFSIKIDEYEVKISSFNNAVTIYIQNFGTIKTFKFVHMSASFLLDGFDKQATYENSGVIFNKYSNDDWKNNLRYNTDEIEIFELHKKLNLALNLSNKAYISLNKLKKENELNAFKHEMNKLKTNFH